MNLARAAVNWSTAATALRRGVISAPTTNTTPVAAWAMTAASVTAMTGGASMMTQS